MKFNESEILELKTSTAELDDAIIAIGAILNKHQKGKLFFGINNKGEVAGQQVSDKTLRDISKSISDHIEPKIYPHVSQVIIEGKQCASIEFEGHDIPYFAFGRAYMRVGTENKQLSSRELEKCFAKKTQGAWEKQISSKTLGDVNNETLKNYIIKANEAKRISFKFINTRSTLNKLNLMHGDNLLNASEILFCNENSLEVQAAVFAGNDKITFLDIQQFKGNLFDLLEKSENYIKEHMNWRAKLTGDGREEIPEVPLRALTESLVNSLCHRDYTNPKGNEVAIFKDRIEIYNPGQFPEEAKIEDYIAGKERSILRNPLIANTLFLSKDIERWGSGIKRIYDACKEEGVKVEFQTLKTGFLVTFYRREVTPPVTHLVTPPVVLTELESKILEIIKLNNYVSRNEIAIMLKVKLDTIKEYISKLKKKGILRRFGKTNAGYWEVILSNDKKEVKNEK